MAWINALTGASFAPASSICAAGPRDAPSEVPVEQARAWLVENGLLPEGDLPDHQLLRRHLALSGATFGSEVTAN